jgi:uncharacterized repeat protein (TIGR01451 family)
VAGNDKVTLCHATGSGSWNQLTVSVSAVSGHGDHPNDVIPEFTTVDNKGNVINYPGKNLDADFGGYTGADVLGNGCATPSQPPAQIARLTVIVKVVNNSGGTKQPPDFSVSATGNGRTIRFPGADAPGRTYTGQPGAYTISESRDPAYMTGYSAGCTGTLNAGDDVTCVITNDDVGGLETLTPTQPPFVQPLTPTRPSAPGGGPAKPTPVTPTRPHLPSRGPGPITPTLPPFQTLASLTVRVKVINDDGGTAASSDFTVLVTGVEVTDGTASFSGSAAGVTRAVTPGAYAVQQSTLDGYATTYADSCFGVLAVGGHAMCTIVDNDIAPGVAPPPPGPAPGPGLPPPGGTAPAHLTVITVVRNAYGGSRAPSDFLNLIVGTPVTGRAAFLGRGETGVTRTVEPGTYAVFETKRQNYSHAYRGACSGVITAGQHRTCIVVNRQQRIPPARVYDLVIAAAGPAEGDLKGNTTWQFEIANNGPAAVSGAAVANTLPSGFRFTQATSAACSARNRVVICALGAMPRGKRVLLAITARTALRSGRWRTTAAVLGRGIELRYRNNVARVPLAACGPGTRLFDGECRRVSGGFS